MEGHLGEELNWESKVIVGAQQGGHWPGLPLTRVPAPIPRGSWSRQKAVSPAGCSAWSAWRPHPQVTAGLSQFSCIYLLPPEIVLVSGVHTLGRASGLLGLCAQKLSVALEGTIQDAWDQTEVGECEVKSQPAVL